MVGMANGIVVLILMMVHRLVLLAITNAELIPLLRVGQYYLVQQILLRAKQAMLSLHHYLVNNEDKFD